MSVKVMAWVWGHSRSNPTQRLVLLAIADTANEDGLDAYPSMAKLMRKTSLGERAIQNAIKGLVALGELHVSVGGGRGHTNRYRVLMVERTVAANPAPETPFVTTETPHQKPRLTNPAPETPFLATVNPARDAPRTVQESSVENSPTGSSTRARTRGTRIPEDFAITSEMRDYARGFAAEVLDRAPNGRFDGFLDRKTADFVDYWVAKPGKDAHKIDWMRTWKRWMRSEIEKYATQPGARGSPSTAIPLDEQCPRHRGNRLGKCRECRADALAKGVPYP